MCGAGLTVWCWGDCVGGEVRQSRAFESCSPGAAVVCSGLAAVAVNSVALIWELARMDILTIRVSTMTP